MEMHYFAWNDMGAGMAAMMLGMGLLALGLLHLLFVVPVFVFGIWMHWRILAKMGYSGSWSLLLALAFLPFFTGLIFLTYIVALWVLAFRTLAERTGHGLATRGNLRRLAAQRHLPILRAA